MRNDDENGQRQLTERLQERQDEAAEPNHVVFDFTGLDSPNVSDLALIITARLESAPEDNVWVRSLPWRTARILQVLRLDHLFRHYPEVEGEPN
jgi:hypothetical protein